MSTPPEYSISNSTRSKTFSTIYLVRHGQTIGNSSRMFVHPSKEVLSPKGRIQANAAGKHLSHVKFDKVYASTLVRAKKTAKLILEHSNHPVDTGVITFDERIKEVDYAIFRGQSYDEPQKIRGKNISESYPYKEFYVEGTEEIESVLLRLDSFWNELFETLDDAPTPETVLVVSHGMLIRILMKYLKLSPEKFQVENFTSSLYTSYLKNTAYHKFQIERRRPMEKLDSGSKPRVIRFWETHKAPHLENLFPKKSEKQ
ncbi:unnamed protein product [Orchesella dallaii]|uniref:Fructose-2,6-bisphosphatase TIGAR n=1 Tax=Orchesella dallaii TaxID=48710 RepID=A0ABP1Q8Y0_9HEXA